MREATTRPLQPAARPVMVVELYLKITVIAVWCSVPQEDGCEIYYAVKFWASSWVRLRMNCTGAPYNGPFTSSTAACTMSSSTPSLLVHDPLGSCLAA